MFQLHYVTWATQSTLHRRGRAQEEAEGAMNDRPLLLVQQEKCPKACGAVLDSNAHYEHTARARDNAAIALATPGGHVVFVLPRSRPRNAVVATAAGGTSPVA